MNFIKTAALSLALLASIASAKLKVEVALITEQMSGMFPEFILSTAEPAVLDLEDIRITATQKSASDNPKNMLVAVTMATKDEKGNFAAGEVMEIALNEHEEEQVGAFGATDGLMIIIRVSKIAEQD